MDANLPGKLAGAVEALGTNAFYDRLLEAVGGLMRNDLTALVRYSRSAPPDLIIPRVEPSPVIATYNAFFYTLDPFFNHWRERGTDGVFRLRSMAANLWRGQYAREFLVPAAIRDEIAVFLPPIGDATPTLILDRATTTFKPIDVARVRALFPLLAALHRQHIATLVSSGVSLNSAPIGTERPLRLSDQRGRTVFTTQAWTVAAALSGNEFSRALDTIQARGPCLVRLGLRHAIRRTRLPADFGPAPHGYCDEVIPEGPLLGPPDERRLPEGFGARLTAREREVVVLMLRGYPVIEIARRLGLRRGTVKNCRSRIYAKMDITTERELFTEYMRAATAPG